MRHSVAGNIVLKCWEQLPSFFESILLDAFTVMPNHIHGIVQLKEGNRNALGQIVRNFKSICTRKIRKYTQIEAIWQDNYFERVIRSERELNLIRLYIDLNPLMWDENKKMYQLEFRSEEELEELLKSYRESNL